MVSQASFHNIAVEEVMDCDPPLVEKDASIRKIVPRVCKKRHVWVVERKGSKKIVGIITEKDLLDVVSPLPLKSHTIGVITPTSLHHAEFKKAGDIMAEPVYKCHPDTKMEEALRLMSTNRVKRLAVTENDEILGELTANIVITTYFSAYNEL